MKYLITLLLLVGCGGSDQPTGGDVVYKKIPTTDEDKPNTVACTNWETGWVNYGPVEGEIINEEGEHFDIRLNTGEEIRICGDCYQLTFVAD